MKSITEKTVLYVKQENGRYKVARDDDIMSESARILWEDSVKGHDVLTSPEAVREFLKRKLVYEYEVFAVVFLDNRHRVIDYEEVFRGTIDGASVHPREIVKEALNRNAAAVILAHNHPSGVAEPSQADIRITQRLTEALALVDIRVLDHLVVGQNNSTSLAERGML